MTCSPSEKEKLTQAKHCETTLTKRLDMERRKGDGSIVTRRIAIFRLFWLTDTSSSMLVRKKNTMPRLTFVYSVHKKTAPSNDERD